MIPIVLSQINKFINSDKGKDKEQPSLAPTAAPAAESSVDNTPADGVSDLAPAPIPFNAVVSDNLPISAIPTRLAYTLPEGVSIEDCSIFYLGSESLGLNNLLITHGKCQVRN